jgi:hypothetical protein
MSYTQVFGGNTIYPSDVSYLALALSADVELEWPLESAAGVNIAARIIDVTPSAAGYYVDMPDATLTGAGQVILFNNVGSYTFYVRDFSNNTIATVASGEQWELYLAATSTAAGTWRVFRFGASTATVQPSALAGPGLTVDGSQLAQSTPVITFSASTSSPTETPTLTASNRASAWVWIGTGTGTLYLPSAATVGNNYFVMVRNSGGGDLVVDPTGVQTINGLPNFTLRPGDSATLITDGLTWYTIGFGQDAVFAFDYTIVTILPIPPSLTTPATFTLSGSNLNRIAYRFEGALDSDCTVIVPSTVQQYWVTNATTGAYTLSLNTASGTAVTIAQNARGIYYCDGTNVVLADTASISLPLGVAQGGTGGTTTSTARLGIGISAFGDTLVTAANATTARGVLLAAASGANSDITSLTGLTTPLSAPQGGTGFASYAVGDLLYASTTTALSKLADVATGNALISGGVSTAPSWGKVGLTTHVSGTLAVANGGTGQTTYTNGQLLIGNTTGNTLAKATLTAGSGISITNGTGSITIAATGGTGTVTSVSFTGGIVSVATATTTPALTVAGTSGGIPYFSSGTTWASSAALAANALVVGGGAGAAPATVTTGTGVVTALGVAVGSAGAVVVNGGALGTPSSGTLSSCTVDGTNAVGFKKVPQSGSDKTTSYPLATGDVGKFIGVGSGGSITIPDATFATGDIISLFNNTSGDITITCSITTAYIGGVNTDRATMTLATRGVATVLFISGTVCVVNGNVS